MLTHKKILQYVTDEGRITSTIDQVTGDGEAAYDGVIVHNATPSASEVEIDIAFAEAKIKSLVLSSSQGSTFRSNANHSGSPGDTIVIPTGGGQVVWNTNDIAANPFANADVTKLYVTNESATTDATVRVRVLLDVTP